MIKICKICGKEFEGTGTSSYCEGPHFKKCEVCGKEFEWNHKNPKKCCSRKCSAQLRKKSILSTVKVCELCGKEFHPKSNTQKYCENDHFRPCPVCGKPVLVLVAHDEARCCSTECSNKLRENTCISKYGVKVASQSAEVRSKLRDIALSDDVVQKRKATCLQNWGVDNPSKHPDVKDKISKTITSDEYKNRVRKTTLQKIMTYYATQSDVNMQESVEFCQFSESDNNAEELSDILVDSLKHSSKIRVCKECGKEFYPKNGFQVYCEGPHFTKCVICGKEFEYSVRPSEKPKTCSKECQTALRKQTNRKRYGVDNVSKLDSVRQKISEANGSEEVKEKRRQTSLARWGVENVSQSEKVKAKQVKTFLEKYGTTNPMKNKEVATRLGDIMSDPEHVDKVRNLLRERYGVDCVNNIPGVREKMIATTLERYGVPYYVLTEEYQHGPGNVISKTNMKFQTLLRRSGIESELEFPLGNRSFDLHVVNSNTLIEINPTYTHNSFGNHWGDGLDKMYHRNKTLLANKHGYRCIHVWEWDNIDKIIHILRPKAKIYARKCKILQVDENTAKMFEEKHHLQGKVRGQTICLGLYYEDELVELMTFGRPRYNKKFEWELLRLCTNSSKQVVGGASKLFQYFVKQYKPTSIISYCDRSKFSGDVYEKMGMKLDRWTSPNKIWSKGSEMITNNLLLQRGYDQIFNANYGKGTSNEELMLEHGWLPVYDCGQSVYVYMKLKDRYDNYT